MMKEIKYPCECGNTFKIRFKPPLRKGIEVTAGMDFKDKSGQFTIKIEKDGNQFHGYIPRLKGLHVPGDTIEETLKNIGDALSAYMQSMIKHGEII